MPNHSTPKNINELVEVLQAGFDEEDLRPTEMTDTELNEELAKRGISTEAAFNRLQNSLEKLRDSLPGKSLSPLEALYQQCRQAIPGSLHGDILELVQSLKPERVWQAEVYAAAIDPQNHDSVEQFRQNLAKLNDLPK